MQQDDSQKPLDRLALTTLVIASMIGAGVYTTSGFAMADLRCPWLVILAWFIGACIAICGAVGYAQLAKRITENGGEYLYLSRFVHPAAGFTAGWVSLLAGFTGAGAFAAVAFETYALPGEFRPDWLPPKALALTLVVLATVAHAFNTRYGARSQNGIVALKLGLLAALIVFAYCMLGHWQGGASIPRTSTMPAVTLLTLATSVMWISLSYSGFNAAIYVAGESRKGASSVGFAMITGTLLVSAIYLLLNAFFVLAPEPSQIAGQVDVAAVAANAVGGVWLERAIRVAICIGLASSVSSVLMSGPRVYSKMANDGYLPRFFVSHRSPPMRSVLMQGAMVVVVVCVSTLQGLLSYLGMTLALTAAATVATLFLPSARSLDAACGTSGRSNLAQAFRLTLALVYVVATLFVAGLAAWNRPVEAAAALGTMCVGGLAYLASRWLPTRETKP
jgi:APA family basic amino acid/polyamine antiporter